MPFNARCMLSATDLAEADIAHLPDRLACGSKAGFDSLLWPVPVWASDDESGRIAKVAKLCKAAGLRPFAIVDLTRFPLHHDLVERHSDAFAIRRDSESSEPVDPRIPFPPKGYALARLQRSVTQELLAGALAERLEILAGLGFEGFQCAPAIPPSLIARLREIMKPRFPDIEFLSESDLASSAQAAGGYDYTILSLDQTCLEAPAFAEEFNRCSTAGPVLCSLGKARGTIAPPLLQARIGAAAALGAGMIVPLDYAATAGELGVVAMPKLLGEYRGDLRRLSSHSSEVVALLRHGASDPRHSDEAALLLINPTEEPQSLACLEDFGARAADFENPIPIWTRPGANEVLAPGEVRTMKVTRKKPIAAGSDKQLSGAAEWPRLVLEDISPTIAGGDFAVKRIVGEILQVEATAFADGHEQLAVELSWREADQKSWRRTRMAQLPNDRWTAEFPLPRMGRHEFRVEAWLDRFGGYRRDLKKKVAAEVAQPVDYAEGVALIEAAARRTKGKTRSALQEQLTKIEATDEQDRAGLLLAQDLSDLMAACDDRPHLIESAPHKVDAERIEARFSSWYELFPRSITDHPDRHGTFADVIGHLPRVRAMGFDTLYFPPIHPIGRTNRKGANNTLTPGPQDPGSPYAIGSAEGGHDAIHPELGSFEDFDRLVEAARDQGLEIALDFAIQASPDHPWLTEHPGWFAWRPDGSMKYAENPPKKYQDIVNVDFYGPDAVPDLWEALRDVVLFWIERGVKTFRVDNPHTKPLPFWEWLIEDVHARHPDAIFLSEAFTRPTMMYRLAKIGFTQSYTYFTWRDRKHELEEYITELTAEPVREFYRPNFFVNTPDINPFFLQTSGRPGFRIRAVLAATLSGLWGVYSGFELCESAPLGPGKEEYLDSEKYQIRVRDWSAPGNIVPDITLLNSLRRTYPALQTHLNTRFYVAHNENIIWYGKPSPGAGDRLDEMIMAMVNLDPHSPQECDFEVPLWEFGLPDHESIEVEDLAAGHRFAWHGKIQHIRLSPDEPYRLWRLHKGGEA